MQFSLIKYLYFFFKSCISYTNLNCASRQPDNNQSGALARICQSFWTEPCVDFIKLVAVVAAALILSHPRGRGRGGQTEVRVKQAG